MGKKSDDGKVGSVKGTSRTTSVQGADEVGSVGGIKPTAGVGGVKGAGAIGKRRPTRVMSLEERDNLFRLIDEEADKLFADSSISEEKKQVLKSAVRMAVDSGIGTEEEDADKKKGKS